MRIAIVAAAVCLSLLAIAGGIAAPPPPAWSSDAPAGATAAPATAAGTAAAPASDAAARHAKRTACLKSAKAKKLVGADKTTFLKSCIAAP